MKRTTIIIMTITLLFGILLIFMVLVYDRQLKEIDRKIEEKNAHK